MLNLKPAGHRVLVKPDTLEEEDLKRFETLKKSGFTYEGTQARAQEAVISGVLVEVGPTAWKAFDDGEPWAKVGDRVYFAKYGGFVVEHPQTGEKLRLLNDEDINLTVEVVNDE